MLQDIVLRKTMIDDCKGPRFEELLGVFSSLVAQKTLLDDASDRSAIKNMLVGGTRTTADTKLLLPLQIAYQGSLGASLNGRLRLDRHYRRFGNSLDTKEFDILQRRQNLKEAARPYREKRLPRRTIEKLEKYVSANWSGESEWVGILVHGERLKEQNSVLERSFDDVWRRVNDNTMSDIRPNKKQSLLQNLEKRVEEQDSRLRKWKDIQQRLIAQTESIEHHVSSKEQKRGSGLGSGWVAGQTTVNRARTELRTIQSNDPEADGWVHVNTRSAHKTPSNAAVAIAASTEAPEQHRDTGQKFAASNTRSRSKQLAMRSGERPKSLIELPPNKNPKTYQEFRKSLEVAEHMHLHTEEGFATKPIMSAESVPSSFLHHKSLYHHEDEPVTKDHGMNASSAAQISASVNDGGISPTRRKASLIERTRMSMAFMSPQKHASQADKSSPIPPPPILRLKEDQPPSVDDPVLKDDQRMETLLDRTRESMLLMSARPPLARRTSKSRHSKMYPTNQFDSPLKQHTEEEHSMTEEILPNDDVDYDSVFKSRPKIAQSPPLRPVAYDAMEVEGLLRDLKDLGIKEDSVVT